LIPYGKHEITEGDIDEVVKVLRSKRLTQGPKVPEFESRLSSIVGSRFACVFNSATSALHVACLALDLGPGDFLCTTPNSFVASANCALYCGASVDFVDIDPGTFNICPRQLADKLEVAEKNGALPKVLVVVHFAGQSCDMEKIAALASRYSIRVIEDASHALGAEYKGKLVGSCIFSDITVFSFHPVKIIATGEGGAVLTNSPVLYAKVKQFGSHGITSESEYMDARPADEIWNYQQIRLGYNYRMTDIAAALGLSQLTRLHEFIAKRRALAEVYDDAFDYMPEVEPQVSEPGSISSYHLYVIRVGEASRLAQKKVYQKLLDAGIGVNLHYIPIYLQPYFQRLGFKRGLCPEAEKFYHSALSLPIYTELGAKDQNYVIKTMKRVLYEV
jgi:UDP-4-amino-4,6-dideoxy-N-acetyl-beta-L-altrosamine transaminase